MSKIKIHDLSPAEADLKVVSLTDKELSVVSGGSLFEFLSTKGSVDWSDETKREWEATWGVSW